MKSILMFEANEIPPSLVADHVRRNPESATAQLLARSRSYETVCEDEIELDPWISWPTLHRGVIDREHHVLHLGQSLDWADRTFPPIWRLLHDNGVSTGVFGALHSSHVPDDAESYAFYVPDYFAAAPYAHPKALLPFQTFNLVMTRRSARNVDTGVPMKEALSFAQSAIGSGVTLSTVAQVGRQLAEERVNPKRKIRRRNLQPVIGLDLFLSLWRKTRPQFANFYTNHVAAAMHRYWAAHFTKDYGAEHPMGEEWIDLYKDELPHAMVVFDTMLAKLMRAVEAHGDAVLVMASSLGQAAIQDTGRTSGFTTVTDVAKLMDFLEVDRADWREGHAMVPCVSIDLNPEKAEAIVERLSHLEVMGARAVRNEREVAPLSFDLKQGRSLHLYFYFEGQEPAGAVKLGNMSAPIEAAGFGFFVHEDNVACSAHHIPEGVLWIHDPAGGPVGARGRISTRAIAPALLSHFGAPRPSYMMDTDLLFAVGPGMAIAAE